MSNPKVAVILAAGVGSRLRPLTDDRPKALVPVGGETILGRAVRLLAAAGVEELVLATGYREDALRRALADSPLRVTYCANPNYDSTQNSVSLLLCRDAVAGRPFYRLDGDVVFHPHILSRLAATTAELAAAVDRRGDLDAEAMKVSCVGERIQAFGKHLDLATAYGESIGIELLRGAAVERIFDAIAAEVAAGRTNLYYEDVYSKLTPDRLDAVAVDVSELGWSEIDDEEDLGIAGLLLASGALDRGA